MYTCILYTYTYTSFLWVVSYICQLNLLSSPYLTLWTFSIKEKLTIKHFKCISQFLSICNPTYLYISIYSRASSIRNRTLFSCFYSICKIRLMIFSDNSKGLLHKKYLFTDTFTFRMFYQAKLVLGSLGKVNFPQLPCKVTVNSYYCC